METEKIYYAVMILLCAASMLLSPFFYLKRTGTGKKLHSKTPAWKVIVVSNLLMIAVLVLIGWKWF